MKTKELKRHLDAVVDLVLRNEGQKLVLQSNDPKMVNSSLQKSLPEKAQNFAQILSDFETEILPFLNRNTSPNFAAYITGSGNKVAAFAEFLKSWYNQNGLKWNNSPIAAELEQLIIQWVAEHCKVPTHNRGVLTSGGSMSNYLSIHFALASKYPDREMKGLHNAPHFTIYCSDQTHSSVDRAMVFLGLGRNQIRKISVNEEYQIDLVHLQNQLVEDQENGFQPLMIIGNAGTTNTGSIDDLESLATIAQANNLWFHVDGAYGLPAIRLPELTTAFKGVEQADSIIINPHKWMYVPFEASCVLLKEIPTAIHFSPDYLFTENPEGRWESSNHTIELSKEFRSLKIWFTMKYYGSEQLTEFIRRDIQQIQYLAKELERIPHLIVDANHPLSILCFRYQKEELSENENEQINIQAVRTIESEGKIFLTGTKLHGKTYMRVYYGNPERTKTDVDFMVQVIKQSLPK